MTLRIEAGLALIDVEWQDAPARVQRRRPRDAQGARLRLDAARRPRRVAPLRRAPRRSGASWSTARRAGLTTGIVVDWADWDRLYRDAGLFPPKSEHPLPYESMILDDDGVEVGYCTSLRLLAGAAAAHRHRAGPPRPRRPTAPTCGSSWPSPTTTPRSGSPRPRCRSSTRRGRRHDLLARLRRDRRRRRPQRPHPRGVPRQGRPAHAGAGEERDGRRRRDHRGADAGLLVHDVLLRAEPAAAGDHPRARPGPARLPAADDAVVVPPDRRRRLPAVRRRPRAEPPGDPPALAAGRGRLRALPPRPRPGLPGRSGRCSTTRRPTSSARTPRTRST